MAVTPLDQPWPKPPVLRQNCLLYVRSYCRLKLFIAWIGNFAYLLRKTVENIKFFIRTAKFIDMIPKHIFWPIIDCFSMYVTGVTRSDAFKTCVVSRRSSPNRWACSLPVTWKRWWSHYSICRFRKPHAANFTTLSFIEPELLPVEVLHCGNMEFRVFFAKSSGNYYFFVRTRKTT